jgi:integrase
MSSSDKRYLELHGRVWRVVVPVPRSLHSTMGCSKLKRSLGTDSQRLANQLKWGVVAELQKQIRHARSGSRSDPLIHEALMIRETALRDDTPDGPNAFTVLDAVHMRADELRGNPIDECPDTGEAIYDTEREALAGTYFAIASGTQTPINVPFERWHREAINRKDRTKGDDSRALAMLNAWCNSNNIPPTVEAITRQVAGRFVGDLPSQGASPPNTRRLTNKTANKYLSCLSGYWKWMKARGLAEENVWREQSLPKERTDSEDRERAFTDEEVKALFAGTPPAALGAAMKIAALSGARIDAVVSLRVKDCEDGVFRFKPQKREDRERYVPIHSALVSLVEERVRGKQAADSLFPEYPAPKSGRERSMPAVKAFVRYREGVGVDEKRPGKRRSLVNFHSFRRWFITKAERAGIPESTIATVVGHKRPGMTFGTYSAGPELEQLCRCVEAVRLPQ